MRRAPTTVAVAFAALCLGGCGAEETTSGQKTPPSGETGAPATAVRKNACALIDQAEIEAIAGQKLDMLHDIEADTKTSCELHPPGSTDALVYVTVYWTGGKELARINQAGMSMAKQLLNDEDTDLEELTGSERVRGLADKAYYSNLLPSWVLKGDVLIEVLSPQFDSEKTKAVFVAVSKKALTRL